MNHVDPSISIAQTSSYVCDGCTNPSKLHCKQVRFLGIYHIELKVCPTCYSYLKEAINMGDAL